jgi:hypothetical protein
MSKSLQSEAPEITFYGVKLRLHDLSYHTYLLCNNATANFFNSKSAEFVKKFITWVYKRKKTRKIGEIVTMISGQIVTQLQNVTKNLINAKSRQETLIPLCLFEAAHFDTIGKYKEKNLSDVLSIFITKHITIVAEIDVSSIECVTYIDQQSIFGIEKIRVTNGTVKKHEETIPMDINKEIESVQHQPIIIFTCENHLFGKQVLQKSNEKEV